MPSRAEDPIVGLDVCGQVFYCHKSTLVQASPYFEMRFKGSFDSDVAYEDRNGRNVYFVERSPQVFPIIFQYMIAPVACPSRLPSFDSNPSLFRALRDEAEYFGLAGLSELLKVTRSIQPQDGNQGVLHWLGCKKGKAPYQNPYVIGAINVGGWVDNPDNSQKSMYELARSATCRASFVQYQGQVSLINRGLNSRVSIESYNYLLWCDHGMERLPVTIDLKSILLRPTHYSLRVSQCYGMQGDWNLEGSIDGAMWDILHAARTDTNLCLTESSDIITKLDKSIPTTSTDAQRSEGLVRLIETEYRHTWELDPPPTQFYRYFRIIGAGAEDTYRDTCLHGEGIEFYGDIYEE